MIGPTHRYSFLRADPESEGIYKHRRTGGDLRRHRAGDDAAGTVLARCGAGVSEPSDRGLPQLMRR